MTNQVKHNYNADQHWAFWTWYDIPDRDNPDIVYLRRLAIVKCPLFAIYVHWIFLPDNDRDCHDHPWNFKSFVLRGGYAEHLYYSMKDRKRDKFSTKEYGRFSYHRMPTYFAHRITWLKENTVTLIITGRRKRTWGFWTKEGWVKYNDYDKGNGPDPFMS